MHVRSVLAVPADIDLGSVTGRKHDHRPKAQAKDRQRLRQLDVSEGKTLTDFDGRRFVADSHQAYVHLPHLMCHAEACQKIVTRLVQALLSQKVSQMLVHRFLPGVRVHGNPSLPQGSTYLRDEIGQ